MKDWKRLVIQDVILSALLQGGNLSEICGVNVSCVLLNAPVHLQWDLTEMLLSQAQWQCHRPTMTSRNALEASKIYSWDAFKSETLLGPNVQLAEVATKGDLGLTAPFHVANPKIIFQELMRAQCGKKNKHFLPVESPFVVAIGHYKVNYITSISKHL